MLQNDWPIVGLHVLGEPVLNPEQKPYAITDVATETHSPYALQLHTPATPHPILPSPVSQVHRKHTRTHTQATCTTVTYIRLARTQRTMNNRQKTKHDSLKPMHNKWHSTNVRQHTANSKPQTSHCDMATVKQTHDKQHADSKNKTQLTQLHF